MPQTSSFRSAKEILVVSFAAQPRAFILSDRNIFYTPGRGRTTAGSNAPGAFLVYNISKPLFKEGTSLNGTKNLGQFSESIF